MIKIDDTLLNGFDVEDNLHGEPDYSLAGADDIYAEVNKKMFDLITKGIKENNFVWRRGWVSPYGPILPSNAVSKKEYRGLNQMLLACEGYDHPYWLTANQIEKKNGTIKEGEKPSTVYLYMVMVLYRGQWMPLSSVAADKDDIEDKVVVFRKYKVYNAEQTEGIDFGLERQSYGEREKIEAAEKIINAYKGPKVLFKGDQPLYSPSRDEVWMVPLERWESAEFYYSVYFHELSHSTKTTSRTGRIKHYEGWGRAERRAYEELVAEITACHLCARAGFAYETEKRSAAYLAGWLQGLIEVSSRDKRVFFTAAAHAQEAAEYICPINKKKRVKKKRASKKIKEEKQELAVPDILKIRFTSPASNRAQQRASDLLISFYSNRAGLSSKRRNYHGYILAIEKDRIVKELKHLKCTNVKLDKISGSAESILGEKLRETSEREANIKNNRKKDRGPVKRQSKIGDQLDLALSGIIDDQRDLLSRISSLGQGYPKTKKDFLRLKLDIETEINGRYELSNSLKTFLHDMYKKLNKAIESWDDKIERTAIQFSVITMERLDNELKNLIPSVTQKKRKLTKDKELKGLCDAGTKSDKETSPVRDVEKIRDIIGYSDRPPISRNQILSNTGTAYPGMTNTGSSMSGLSGAPKLSPSPSSYLTPSYEDEEVEEKGIPDYLQALVNQTEEEKREPEFVPLRGKIGRFMGLIDRYEWFLILRGQEGSGKTSFLYQLMNAVAETGLRVIFFSLEMNSNSNNSQRLKHWYIDPANAGRIDIVNSVPKGIQTIYDAAEHYDMVVIDSWGKLNVGHDEIDKLRKTYPRTLFASIFQETTAGTARGGSAASYDGDCSLRVLQGYYAGFKKNRGQHNGSEELIYMVRDRELMKKSDLTEKQLREINK